MTKHVGIFEKMGLYESGDSPPNEAAPDVPIPQAQPPPPMQPQSYVTSFAPAAPVLDADDQKRLQALSQQVYATPSSYVVFQRVRESLGNTPDLQSVLRVLIAANPGVTVKKVLTDIDAHLGIIETKRAEFEAQVQQARATRIDGPAKEIADLTTANQTAVQQIDSRTTRIAQLQKAAQDADKAISDGAARFKLIEEQLNAPLIQTKRMLSGAS